MTAARIKEAALKHFALHGYAGASLAHIADEVGIKKPSLYAHFKGKDDLFLSVMQDACRAEMHAVGQFVAALDPQSSLYERLYALLQAFRQQYETSERSKFMLRMSYMPPESLYEPVMKQLYAYLDWLESKLITLFTESLNNEATKLTVRPQQAAAAFLCLLDGVMVEMLYGGQERYARRLDASWPVFWKGIAEQGAAASVINTEATS